MLCNKSSIAILSMAALAASAAAINTLALRGLQAATTPMVERVCNAVSAWEKGIREVWDRNETVEGKAAKFRY